jgi:serine/threonine protein kinase
VLNNSNDLLGQTLGTCTLQRMIGRGGMGAVYLAQQSRPRRAVAVKVLLPGITEQRPREEFLARFRREADAIAALDHVNIMPIYEYGEQGEVAFLVMPYVNGGTLREMLERRGPLPLEEIATTLEQVSAGLDSAHAQGIVHRDLKPGNILFHADGRVLIADFGLAKVVNDTTDSITGNGHLTSTGTIVGTPEYLSPEQGTGDAIDYRTDVYSLGVVVYHMLAGRVPYSGTSPVAVAIKHAIEQPPPITRFNPAIPPGIEQIVLKAMAKAPADRYASAGEFARAFYKEAASLPGSTLPPMNSDWTHSPFMPKFSTPLPSLTPTTSTPETPQADDTKAAELPTKLQDQPVTAGPVDSVSAEHAAATVLAQEDAEQTPVALSEQDEKVSHREPVATMLAEPIGNIPMDATVADYALVQDKTVQEPVTGGKQEGHEEKQGEQLVLQTLADEHALRLPSQRHTSSQSRWLVIVGCVLALFIIAGVLAYMRILVPTSSSSQTNTAITRPTSQAAKPAATHSASTASTPQTIQSSAPLPTPASSIAAYGAMTYGTALPGNCDQKGNYWSITAKTQISCAGYGMDINNSSTGSLDGVLLKSLPTGQTMPDNYLIQVQTTVNSADNFGVFFRAQDNSFQNGYALMFDPNAQNFNLDYYKNGTPTIVTGGISTQGLLTGSITLDVVVQGNNYFSVYINGTQVGDPYSTYGYSGGKVGLITEPATTVTFKNFELYPLQ